MPSHDRPLRLRWLLNALERQTVEPARFEVLVGHDSHGAETESLLREHPLARAGILRNVRLPPGSAPPGANRNAALRLARAPVVAFTDDDCRPPADWLQRALAATEANPGAIVQGKTEPDPDERALIHASPWPRTQRITPPVVWAQCCNIFYPRELLDRLGGFDEKLLTGEDADLAMRAVAAGAAYVGAPEVVTFHAVETPPLHGRLRGIWRWRHLPEVIGRHPSLRRHAQLRIFWRRRHVWLPFALAAAVGARARPAWGLLALPWLYHAAPRYGLGGRGVARSLQELPGRAAIDLAEFATLAYGSVRSRRLFL